MQAIYRAHRYVELHSYINGEKGDTDTSTRCLFPLISSAFSVAGESYADALWVQRQNPGGHYRRDQGHLRSVSSHSLLFFLSIASTSLRHANMTHSPPAGIEGESMVSVPDNVMKLGQGVSSDVALSPAPHSAVPQYASNEAYPIQTTQSSEV